MPEYQFYMTSLGGGSSGRIDFPYDPSSNNRYAIATTDKDVRQCTGSLNRHTNNQYSALVASSTGTRFGAAWNFLPNAGDTLIVPGQAGVMDLAISATGPVGNLGTVGSQIDFNYGAHTIPDYELGTDFHWSTLSTGTDGHVRDENPDNALQGGYCTIITFESVSPHPGDPGMQQIKCYFLSNAD